MQGDGADVQLDVQRALEDQEEIVRILMLMPVKFALDLGHHHIG
jgi:hypothetical protein